MGVNSERRAGITRVLASSFCKRSCAFFAWPSRAFSKIGGGCGLMRYVCGRFWSWRRFRRGSKGLASTLAINTAVMAVTAMPRAR